MSYESNVSYVSKQLRQKNTHNLRNMKADSARRISRCPSSIVLFNQFVQVNELNEQYGYLESGPLLPSPWYQSQFLSHAFYMLNEKAETSYISNYMNVTEELGDFAQGYSKIRNFLLLKRVPMSPASLALTGEIDGYTLFAPRDDAFWKILIQDATAPDPFMQVNK